MSNIAQSIEVDVPVRTAYDQWTQFESFPHFMDGVERVDQIDATHLRWVAKVAGEMREWNAVITEQTPDERISWRSTSGKPNAGTVSFEALSPSRCRVSLLMEWEPEGVKENVGAALSLDADQVKGDLGRFKEFIEARGAETGAWRGEVVGGSVR